MMTTGYWCVIVAGLLPYASTMIAKAGAPYDNRAPRDWLARQEGWRKRANASQQNGFEAFPFFAAGVVVAHLTHAPQDRIDLLALGFVAARVAYLGCYLADLAALRSVVWMTGLGCAAALFLQGS